MVHLEQFSTWGLQDYVCVSSQIVKFSQLGQDRVSPVCDVDLGIYQLQRSERLLGERVEVLGQEADRCDH